MKLNLFSIAFAYLFFTIGWPQDETLKASMKRGEVLFKTCAGCHGKQGQGYKNLSPPLAKSDYLERDITEIIKVVKFGLEGEIVVNGKTYNGKTPPQKFDDQQIADILNYVRNSFGNAGEYVSKAKVAAIKSR